MTNAPASALTDITREADVKTLVDTFCEKVNQDEVLSPAFNAVARVHWPHHLFTLYNFWSTALFGPKTGRQSAASSDLGLPLEGPNCRRWQNLFDAAVRENFAGPKAEEARHKVLNLGALLDASFPSRNTTLTVS
ncbi:group III truncated hemoglobin [Hymenobacter jeollabukensis]|uniref:Group III truncated hemoglobin n=1 Tax=Hymenobacter jeollabukensis TaxID=2025313 RepID=A0A5R8WT89_9BACT|nr:group III truncated hemoglobin [Hymenobacter jeollabukensis]TLM94079.1 group III truncated hemoglobin [Hymenobacter jeollabukensis]